MVTTTRDRPPNPRKQAEHIVGVRAALEEADAYARCLQAYSRVMRQRIREAYEEAAAIETEQNDKAA